MLIENGGNFSNCLSVANPGEVWWGPLSGGDYVCLLLNRYEDPLSMGCPFNLFEGGGGGGKGLSWKAIDLWSGETILRAVNGLRVWVQPHSAAVYRLSKNSQPTKEH